MEGGIRFYMLHGHSVTPYRTTYAFGGGLAVGLLGPHGEEFGYATVNLMEPGAYGRLQYADINNFPGIDDWLQDNGLAEPTGEVGHSGYCDYPLMAFDRDSIPTLAQVVRALDD